MRLVRDPGDDGHVNLDYVQVVEPSTERYEAEDAQLAGGANAQTEHAGYSGTGYVGGMETEGASVTFTVDAEEAGDHDLTLGYANGPHPSPGLTKTVLLSVNDGPAQPVTLANTSAWNSWGTSTETVALEAGANTVTYAVGAGDGQTQRARQPRLRRRRRDRRSLRPGAGAVSGRRVRRHRARPLPVEHDLQPDPRGPRGA